MSLKSTLTAAVLLVTVAATPASAQTAPGFAAAEQAYRLQAEGNHQAALEQARLAVTAAPQNGDYWALLAQEAAELGEFSEAAEAYRHAASLTQDGEARGFRLRAAAYAYVLNDDRQTARDVLAQAENDPLVSIEGSVDWAMIAISASDDRMAQRLLSDGSLDATLTRQQLLDSAYSAKRRGLDARAVTLFRLAQISEPNVAFAAEQHAAIEREIALLDNQWSLSGQIAYAESGRPIAIFNQPATTGQSLQGGLELGFRPMGWQNGRPLTVFGRVFAATPVNEGSLSSDVVQGWVGVQYKPLSNANFVLEASRLFAINDAAINDWGLRAAFSQDRGLNDFAGRSDWATWRLYGDVAYLVESDVTYGTFEGRYGRAFSSGEMIFTPHALAYAGFDSNRLNEWGTAIGAGLSARRWLDSGTGKLTPSYVDLTIQYREAISGTEQVQGLNVVVSFGR